jgi:hypothetical protein
MNDIYSKVLAAMNACRDSISTVAEKSQAYIDEHDKYLEATVRDASIMKRVIKSKIERAYDED